MPRDAVQRSWGRVAALLALVLVACGGDEVDSPPPATTVVVAASGGQLDAPLDDGARMRLEFAPGALPRDTAVTVTPAGLTAEGAPRFRIAPGPASFAAPVQLTVWPGRRLAAADAPAFHVTDGTGSGWIRSALQPQGSLTATLEPALFGSRGAAAKGRAMPAARQRFAAQPAAADAGDAGDAEVSVVLLAPLCRDPAPTLALAADVLQRASDRVAIARVVEVLFSLAVQCGAVPDADQTVVMVRGFIADHQQADLKAWTAVDHGDVATASHFNAGLERALTWGAAALELDLPADWIGDTRAEIAEFGAGLLEAIRTATPIDVAIESLRSLLPLAVLAEQLGGDDFGLLSTVGGGAAALVHRAYSSCTHADILLWASGLEDFPGAYSAQARIAMATQCGLQMTIGAQTAQGEAVLEPTVSRPADDERGLLPMRREVTVPFDATLMLQLEGPSVRCAERVISAPAISDDLVVMAADTVVAQVAAAGGRFESGTLPIALPALLASLGRAPATQEPLELEVRRVRARIQCPQGDANEGSLLELPDDTVYRLVLTPPTPTLAIDPPAIQLAAGTGTTFRAKVKNLPDTAVTWSASGGTINADGRLVAPAQAGSITVTATSVALPSLSARAVVTVVRPVVAPATPVKLAQGTAHACAIDAEGGARCWGRGSGGALGQGALTDSAVPVGVVGLAQGALALAANNDQSCAITVQGEVLCWGVFNDGTSLESRLSSRPVAAVGLESDVTALSVGYLHTCALRAAGGIRCWGLNQLGQLGQGSASVTSTAGDVVGLGEPVQTISAGVFHTCAVLASGRIACWGDNSFSQLGIGPSTLLSSPTPLPVVDNGQRFVSLGAGHYTTCAVDTGGRAWCWGATSNGQLGDGRISSRSNVAVQVTGVGGATAISVGLSHACAYSSSTVFCWGLGRSGQLGQGSAVDSAVAVTVQGLPAGATIRSVTTGTASTCAELGDGRVFCWGSTLTDLRVLVPTQVPGLP